MADEAGKRGRSVEEDLRAAREVIAALQRRIARAEQHRELDSLPVDRAIATLESTVEQRTRALRASEAHYRALFDHSPNLGFLIDDLGIIIRANASAAELLGGAVVGELVDRPLVELFEGEARDAVEELLTEGDGGLDEIEVAGGRIVDLSVASVPGFGHTQVIMRDVSARVELSRELDHARRLAGIGHLAAGVAHEINNPLAVLQLGLGELAERGDALDPADRESTLRDLRLHTERIARIVTNLGTFAAPDPPERTRIPLTELVASAKRLAGQSIDELCVKLRLEPEDLAILADRAHIEQVMVNLLTNAARAMAGTGCVEITGEQREDRVRICVLDRGGGIPAAVLEQIFTPFVSGGSGVGPGLGLALSWGLVQENQGNIRAFNRPEGGACFELELPCAPPLEPVPALVPTPAELETLKILCVEDEPSLRRSLVRLLGVSGHEAIGVESAEEAVEQLEHDDFGLVISDVRLPGMSGDRLRELIVERHPGLRDRVLLMSGFFPEQEDIRHFLQKPFSLRQLNAAIEAIVIAS
jgi:PAS domain S-box-containing protein